MLAIRKARLPRHGVLDALARPPACTLQRPTGELRLRLSSSARPRNGPPSLAKAHTRGQARYATSPDNKPPPNQQSFGQVVRRAMRLSNIFKGQTLRQMFRDSPEETSLALFLLIGTAGVIGYVVYLYFSYFYSTFFTRYPPEIAKSLRRALYYSNESRDDKLALKYYKLALEQCHTHGLDPFSDEVMGIKIQMAAWLEKIGHVKAACDVLSMVLNDNKQWLDLFETAPRNLPRAPVPGVVMGEGESQHTITEEEFEQWLWSSRRRILAKSCAISTKLGQLYIDDHVLDQEKSHESLMWAVTNSVRESARRATEGVKECEGDWLTAEEIGGALEALALSFERREQFALALPLFFQAVRLCQKMEDQCHLAVIMNNLAVCFAQHPPHEPYDLHEGDIPEEHRTQDDDDGPWNREKLLDYAHNWAINALAVAMETKGENRTAECDQACAVAFVNLGDIVAMSGNHTEARRWYKHGIRVSEEHGYAEGVQQAQAGLARLA